MSRSLKRTSATKGCTPEQIEAMSAAKERSNARTPKAILDAFFPAPISVSSIKLRQITLGDIMLLEAIDSPFADEDLKAALAELNGTALAPAVFILALPFEKSAEAFAAGRAAFDAAVLDFAGRIPAKELHELGGLVGQALASAFATVQPVAGVEKKTTRASDGD